MLANSGSKIIQLENIWLTDPEREMYRKLESESIFTKKPCERKFPNSVSEILCTKIYALLAPFCGS